MPYDDVRPYATDDEAFSSVVQLIVAVEVLIAFDPGVMIGPAKSVVTVNARAVEVEVFPNASVTLTYRLYDPFERPLNVLRTPYEVVRHADK